MLLLLLLGTVAGWTVACAALVQYLRDWMEPPSLVHMLAIVCLVVAGLPLIMLPFELNNLSVETVDASFLDEALRRARAFDWLFEYARYAVLVLLFVLVPCALIMSHSVSRGVTVGRALGRGVCVAACVATCGLAVGLGGALLREFAEGDTEGTQAILQSPWHADMGVVLNSLFAVTMVAGLALMCCHTALSLSELPFDLVAPPMLREVEHIEQGAASLTQTREEIRQFRSSFELRGRWAPRRRRRRRRRRLPRVIACPPPPRCHLSAALLPPLCRLAAACFWRRSSGAWLRARSCRLPLSQRPSTPAGR